jgi:hypothetical protein
MVSRGDDECLATITLDTLGEVLERPDHRLTWLNDHVGPYIACFRRRLGVLSPFLPNALTPAARHTNYPISTRSSVRP